VVGLYGSDQEQHPDQSLLSDHAHLGSGRLPLSRKTGADPDEEELRLFGPAPDGYLEN
jgi:hypothetical protein